MKEVRREPMVLRTKGMGHRTRTPRFCSRGMGVQGEERRDYPRYCGCEVRCWVGEFDGVAAAATKTATAGSGDGVGM